MAKSKEFQSYNSRNKKWVHFKSGKIVKTSDNKLKGVPVRTSSAKKKKQACSAAGSRLRACSNPSGSGQKKRKATGGKNPWWPYS